MQRTSSKLRHHCQFHAYGSLDVESRDLGGIERLAVVRETGPAREASEQRTMVGSTARATAVTAASMMVYGSSQWPLAKLLRSWHLYGLPVLLNGVIGIINAWWPDTSVRELRDEIRELTAEVRASRENRGTHYVGPDIGAPNSPPIIPPLS